MGGGGFGTDFESRVVERMLECGAWVSPTVNQGWGRRIEKDGEPLADLSLHERPEVRS